MEENCFYLVDGADNGFGNKGVLIESNKVYLKSYLDKGCKIYKLSGLIEVKSIEVEIKT